VSWTLLVAMASAAVVLPGIGVVALLRAGAAPPMAAVHVAVAPSWGVPATDPSLPWPPTGQAAVAIPALGFSAQSGAEHAVPIASMTKVMTAYIILRDHPLAQGENGPNITVTPADAADYATDTVTDQSSVLVTAGEVLTERQMLEGMIVHSANDLAFALACWDAGSLPAFVAKMNSTAASLGMTRTHYADASGYTPQSESTPSDLLKVTSLAMENPVFAQAVTMPAVTLPLAGTVTTYTPLLPGSTGGVPGVVGVKSGFTTAAGGGDILAYQATVAGRPLLVLAVVTSQEGPNVLDRAGQMDLTLAQATAGEVRMVRPMAAGTRVATLAAAGATAPVVTGAAGSLLAWPGQRIRQAVVVTRHLRAGAPAGAQVGTVLFTLGQQQVAVPIRTARRLPAPTLAQRLF